MTGEDPAFFDSQKEKPTLVRRIHLLPGELAKIGLQSLVGNYFTGQIDLFSDGSYNFFTREMRGNNQIDAGNDHYESGSDINRMKRLLGKMGYNPDLLPKAKIAPETSDG